MRSFPNVSRPRVGIADVALVLVIGIVLAGCNSDPPASTSSEAVLADSLAEGYRWLEEQYEEMGTPMPPMMRGMQGRMQAMHGRMKGRRDSMEGEHGRGKMMGRMHERMGRGGMMEGGETEGPPRDTAHGPDRMGHRDMSAMHETMARMRGSARMAARHRKMARWHEQMMGGSADESTPSPGESVQGGDDAVPSGKSLFARQCASCHGQNGQGVSGAFPPLSGSEWVIGDVSVLARIVLHGLEGPVEVNGKRYDGVMPAFGNRLSNPEVAELLTFLRTSLNEEESSVTAEEIAQIREAYADRNRAWRSEVLQSDGSRPPSDENDDES